MKVMFVAVMVTAALLFASIGGLLGASTAEASCRFKPGCNDPWFQTQPVTPCQTPNGSAGTQFTNENSGGTKCVAN